MCARGGMTRHLFDFPSSTTPLKMPCSSVSLLIVYLLPSCSSVSPVQAGLCPPCVHVGSRPALHVNSSDPNRILMLAFSKKSLQGKPTLHSGEGSEGKKKKNTKKLMVASPKIDVLREKLYVLAVSLNVGVSDCQGLLLKLKGFSLPAATVLE